MRRVVNYIRVGYSTTSYAMWLLCRDIRRKPLAQLVDILWQKLATDDVTFDGSPAKGRGGIGELALNQFSRRYIFHLLARLTAFTEAGSVAGSVDKYVDREVKNPFDISTSGRRTFPATAIFSLRPKTSSNGGITLPPCCCCPRDMKPKPPSQAIR